MTPTCNICGRSSWGDMGKRKNVRCTACGSLERTRVIKLFLARDWTAGPGRRVFHLAPERGLYGYLASLDLKEYRAVDFCPENFRFAEIERFDLCSDGPQLPSNRYDLILHAHVMEHIPCNVTAALAHLHRSLTPDGLHLLCIPFMHGESEEDLSALSPEEAQRRFGQSDHVRKFGKEDLARNLGMAFRLPEPYSLLNYFSADVLRTSNVPEREWHGLNGTSVFPLRKSDYLL